MGKEKDQKFLDLDNKSQLGTLSRKYFLLLVDIDQLHIINHQ